MAAKPSGFKALRSTLLTKLNKNRKWLSDQAKAITKTLPMETRIAQAVVAFRSGIPIHKYLKGADLESVQNAIGRLGDGRPHQSNGTRAAPPARARKAVADRTVAVPKAVRRADGILAASTVDEAIEMAKAYPLLFVLERSIRAVIKGVMEAKYGADWWNSALTSAAAKTLKDKVDQRLKRDEEASWHPKRGAHQIDYIDLTDLLTIAASKPDVFFDRILGTRAWFTGLIEETSPSRNVVCHMNGLNNSSVDALKVRLDQWQNHVLARASEITAAMTPTAATK